VKALALGPEHGNQLRRKIQHLPEFILTLA
jgi:hypothetical protein